MINEVIFIKINWMKINDFLIAINFINYVEENNSAIIIAIVIVIINYFHFIRYFTFLITNFCMNLQLNCQYSRKNDF